MKIFYFFNSQGNYNGIFTIRKEFSTISDLKEEFPQFYKEFLQF